MLSISLCSVIPEKLDNFFFNLQFSIKIIDGFGLIKTLLGINFSLVRVKNLAIASVDYSLRNTDKEITFKLVTLSDGNFHPTISTNRDLDAYHLQ